MQLKLQQGILKVLAYFDLFDYPLSKEEILFFLDHRSNEQDLDMALILLAVNHKIFVRDEFYLLRDNQAFVERRRMGNSHATRLMITAKKIASFLFQFPFVRGIGISGSLSKNMATADSDIDFFIITSANRLWIARTMMHLLKKASFLVGRQHWYCMNYYVDEVAMEIEEKNIFTAIELITLLPVRGNGTMDAFFDANNWAGEYYPNYRFKTVNHKTSAGSAYLKKIMESMFNNRFGDWLDNYFMNLTASRWGKKEAELKLNVHGNRMGMRAGKHFSKPNPVFFQKKILSRYMARLNELSPQWGVLTTAKKAI